MAVPLSSMTAREFDAFCAQVDAEAEEARSGGFVSGDVIAKGEAAIAEAARRGRPGIRRPAAALALAACTPSSPPRYFGTCPAGQQYPKQISPGVWKCVNP